MMNKISRLFLVFILTITTVFAVSACTKKEDNQDKNTIMTEEPGIPLETYLNGNYTNLKFLENYGSGDPGNLIHENFKKYITLKPSKHLKASGVQNVTFAMSFAKKAHKIIKKNNLNINFFDSNSFLNESNWIQTSIGSQRIWSSIEAEYSVSYYKDRKNIYTKKFSFKKKPDKYNLKAHNYYENLHNLIKEKGLYCFHIHEIKAGAHCYDASEYNTYLKDHVFAFQIGDGEEVG